MTALLECVVNISEGREPELLTPLALAAGPFLLDVHTDEHHNRSVFTLAGPSEPLVEAVRALAAATVERLDLRSHQGVHPRIGVLDVVPFVALARGPLATRPLGVSLGAGPLGAGLLGVSLGAGPLEAGPLEAAVEARDGFAAWAGDVLGLPCFLYGTGRTLPQLRREAWNTMPPDTGPPFPHPTAGAAAVGARPLLVAYNLWLADADLETARRLAAELRGPAVRALALPVGDAVQVSCNLIDPRAVGPAAVFDAVVGQTAVARAELVGLVPAAVLGAIPEHRWPELDLDRSRTIEARLEQAGLDGGR